jgi:hypothetical protein
MHATEVVADACPDGVWIARRNRYSAGVELSRRCYLVVAVVASVSAAVEMAAAADRAVGIAGIDCAGHKTHPGFTHRQTFLGVLNDRCVLRCCSH